MEKILISRNLIFKNFLYYPDICVEKKTVTFITGESGSGKTTLFKMLNGTVSPSTGEILFHNTSIVGLNKVQLRRKILLVKQNPYLFNESIYENFLIFHRYNESICPSQASITNFLKLCCIQVDLNTPCINMSGGEQQRIAIARALLNHPELILADEPTGNLDPETSNEIMTLLKQVAFENNSAVVMATHDYHMIQNFPGEAIRCEDGKVTVLDTAELFE